MGVGVGEGVGEFVGVGVGEGVGECVAKGRTVSYSLSRSSPSLPTHFLPLFSTFPLLSPHSSPCLFPSCSSPFSLLLRPWSLS